MPWSLRGAGLFSSSADLLGAAILAEPYAAHALSILNEGRPGDCGYETGIGSCPEEQVQMVLDPPSSQLSNGVIPSSARVWKAVAVASFAKKWR